MHLIGVVVPPRGRQLVRGMQQPTEIDQAGDLVSVGDVGRAVGTAVAQAPCREWSDTPTR